MLREEDELSGTWESEGEDEDAGPDPHGMESDINLTEVDMSDMDMNKVEPDRVVGIFTKHNSNSMENGKTQRATIARWRLKAVVVAESWLANLGSFIYFDIWVVDGKYPDFSQIGRFVGSWTKRFNKSYPIILSLDKNSQKIDLLAMLHFDTAI